jgi:opacity protein-like surface antigen
LYAPDYNIITFINGPSWVNAGYEFIKHIPVSIGVEYAVLDVASGYAKDAFDASFIRIPVTAGYCHYFGSIRLFAGAGMFASFGKRKFGIFDTIIYENPDDPNRIYLHTEPKINPHSGFVLQGGIGYKIIDKLLLSASFEYNRPFKEKIDAVEEYNEQAIWPSYRFAGATLGASWYF